MIILCRRWTICQWNKGTFSRTLFQTPEDRLIYLLHCSVCVDIGGVFTRALKLCWHCSKADNDWLYRCRRKHLEIQWDRPQQMLMLLLPEKLLHLQVDISRTPSINTVVKTNFLISVLCVVDLSQLISINPEKPGATNIFKVTWKSLTRCTKFHWQSSNQRLLKIDYWYRLW